MLIIGLNIVGSQFWRMNMGGCVLAFPVFWSQFEVLIVCMVFDAICIVSIYLISLSYHMFAYVLHLFAFVKL